MKTFLKVGGVVFVLIALFVINVAYYPFFTSHPNYSDVERVFNKMQFPSDWQEIRSSENRGIAGRACPIESESKCYHKSKAFKVAEKTSMDTIEAVLKQTGCPIVAIKENRPTGGEAYTTFKCSIEALEVSGEIEWKNEPEVYIGVRT